MPSILSRRRGSLRAQPVDQSTAFSASAAATSAFLQTSKSTTSLSSAAAAAALRSHPSSPEPVGSLQTKRMVRRGSTSSNGSGNGARGGIARPGLQRSNSSGSMTERSFRASSPAESDRRSMSMDSGAPPIPPIPADAHQRTLSLDRTQRVTSPTSPTRGVDRISSPLPTTSRQAKRLSNVAEWEEADGRPESPVSPSSPSRNFSRPMSSQATAPVISGVPKKYTHGTGSWYTQPSSTSAPARPMTADGSYRPLGPPLDLSSVANRPVSKNRISSAPGSHLARANHGQTRSFFGPPSRSDDDDDSAVVFDKNTRTFIRTSRSRTTEPSSPDSPKAQVVYDPHTRSLVSTQEGRAYDSGFTTTPVQSDMVSSPEHRPRIVRDAESGYDPALWPPPRNPARVLPDIGRPTSPRTPQILHKQPSVVREDFEAERRAEASGTASTGSRDIPRPSSVTAGTARTYATPTAPHQRSASLEPPLLTGAGRGRDTSTSRSRSPHFSAVPILKPERHEPPPRGVSPAKPALKHSPASSVRTESPLANFSPHVAASTSTVSPPSEMSEPSQDGLDSGKKRKSVRVSFDEHPQDIEPLAATTIPVATSSFEEDYDDDGLMKPRPALPSFGSIRRDRMQPELVEKVTEMPPERHEASNDHAIGGILRNSLQPLPPEVTSKESAGYASDESSEYEVPAVSAAANPPPAEVGAGLESRTEGSEPIIKDFAAASSKEEGNKRGADDADVPAINLLPPTPGVEDDSKKDLNDQEDGHKDLADEDDSFEAGAKARNSTEIVVPGSWGDDEDKNEDGKADESLKAASEQQPSSADQTDTLSPVLHASPLQLSDIDEDSDDSAEFSDAVEDPEDLDDGGFASLDAIVASPIVPPSPTESKGKPRTVNTQEPPESPTVQPMTKKPENADPNIDGNWGVATAYWSQLSKEKREQIERRHLSSDDDDDERPAPKPVATRKPKATKPATDAQVTSLPVARPPKQAPTVQRESAQPAMRKSMRAQTGPAPVSTRSKDGVQMRSSMRSGGSMSPSLRSGGPPRRPQSEYVEPRGTLQKKNLRPTSSTSIASSPSGSIMQTQQTAPAPGAKPQDSSFPSFATKKSTPQRRTEPPQVSARLQRELAKGDDSDSESSFKRRRRGNSGSTLDSTGRYTMRHSMRGASIDETPAPVSVQQRPQSLDVPDRSKSGFRLRSLSPPSLFGRKKVEANPTPTGSRTTLRSAPAAKSSGTVAPPSRAAPATAPRYKSRFADSDDSDEDAAPSRSFFKSRFVDSDDDEPASPPVPTGLAPVRGIPRRPGQDDGDSTDLEDEDDDRPRKTSKSRSKVPAIVTDPADVERAMAAARRNLGISEEAAPAPAPTSTRQPPNEGSALAKGSLRNKPADVKEERPVASPQPESPVRTTPEKKRKGLMSSILRRNRNSSSSVQQLRTTSPPPALPTSPVPMSPATAVKSSPIDDTQISPSSPSSPLVGKLIRRRSDQPAMARMNSNYSTATASPATTSPTAATTQNDEDWPLSSPSIPPVPPIPADLVAGAAARPDTSDGFSPEAVRLARTMRPDLAPRSKSGPQRSVRIQAGEEGSEPGEREKDMKAVYSRRTGRKKKFGMLRRAFGLDD